MPQCATISLEERPRYRLLDGSTPIQRLARLERALGLAEGPGIYVKRDDLMASAGAATSSGSWSSSLATRSRRAATRSSPPARASRTTPD